MVQQEAIRKIIAFLLLVVFAVSTTPKIFFHDAIANHKDGVTCNHPQQSHCVHQQGFQCHFDTLVVTAPYVVQDEPPLPCAAKIVAAHYARFSSHPYLLFLLHAESRGPPAV